MRRSQKYILFTIVLTLSLLLTIFSSFALRKVNNDVLATKIIVNKTIKSPREKRVLEKEQVETFVTKDKVKELNNIINNKVTPPKNQKKIKKRVVTKKHKQTIKKHAKLKSNDKVELNNVRVDTVASFSNYDWMSDVLTYNDHGNNIRIKLAGIYFGKFIQETKKIPDAEYGKKVNDFIKQVESNRLFKIIYLNDTDINDDFRKAFVILDNTSLSDLLVKEKLAKVDRDFIKSYNDNEFTKELKLLENNLNEDVQNKFNVNYINK